MNGLETIPDFLKILDEHESHANWMSCSTPNLLTLEGPKPLWGTIKSLVDSYDVNFH